MINIKVFNREEALMQMPQEPTAVISIHTPDDDPAQFEVYGNLKAVLTLAFDDLANDSKFEITFGHGKRMSSPITAEQATQIAQFVKEQVAAGIKDFIVHCDAGVSRSPGVAVTLEEQLNGNKLAYKMYPIHNSLVATRVREAFQRMEASG